MRIKYAFIICLICLLYTMSYTSGLEATYLEEDGILMLNGSANDLFILCLSEINCTVGSYSTTMTDEIQNISIITNFPSWFPVKNVTNTIWRFFEEGGTEYRESLSFTTEVPQNSIVETPTFIRKNVNVNSTENVLSFFVHNKGNEILDLTAHANSSILSFSKEIQNLGPNENRSILIYFDINLTEEPINHTVNIVVDNNDISELILANITVIDNIAPHIKIIANDTEYMKDVFIEFNVSDNIGLEGNISVNINGPGSDLWQAQISLDNPIYKFRYTDIVGEYTIVASVFDTSGNEGRTSIPLNVTSRNIISFEISNEQDYGDVKIQEYNKLPLFEIAEDIGINITLSYYSGNAKVYIDDENSPRQIEEGDTYHIDSDGLKFLGFRANGTGYAEGTLEISTDENVDLKYDKVNFYINFLEYDTPEVIEHLLFGQFPEKCEPAVDEYNNTKYKCTIWYPINIDMDEMPMPIAKGAYDLMQEDNNNTVNGLKFDVKTANNNADLAYFIAIILVVVLIIYIFFNEKIRSKLRLKLR